MARARQADIVDVLPNSIVAEILSRMPIKDAVRTSVLCKKMRDAWKGIPKITFRVLRVVVDGEPEADIESKLLILLTRMQDVLLRHYGGICEAVFTFGGCDLNVASVMVPVLASLSQRHFGTLKKLALYMPRDHPKLILPSHLTSLENLEHLTLLNCVVNNQFSIGASRFRNVKYLMLIRVDTGGTAQKLGEFLSRFQALEDLNLIRWPDTFVMDRTTEGLFTFYHLASAIPKVSRLVLCSTHAELLATNVQIPEMVLLTSLDLRFSIMDSKQLRLALSLLGNSPNINKVKIDVFHDPVLDWRTPTSKEMLLQHQGLNMPKLQELLVFGVRDLHFEIKFIELILKGSPNLRKAHSVVPSNVNAEEYEEIKVALLSLESACIMQVTHIVRRA